MAELPEEIKRQIDAAYDFRGHVTIRFKDGKVIEGFLYNREFDGSLLRCEPFIDVMIKDSDSDGRYPISSIESITITGKDYAAGNSYEDYLKKKAAAKE